MANRTLSQRLANAALSIRGIHKLVSLALPKDRLFQIAYAAHAWGSSESGSGVGSELGATANIRAYLPELFRRYQVSRFLDAPCGDWNWMSQVDLRGIQYIGADVVTSVVAKNSQTYGRAGVQFISADLTKDRLPAVDMVMCRDCWVHLSFADIAAMLANFRRTGAKWLLVSHTPSWAENQDKITGLNWRHLNLQVRPFNFPPPIESRKDHYPEIPFEIGLWQFDALPEMQL